MRRRVSFAFAAAAAAAACFAAAGTAGTVPLHLTEAGGAVFPQRTYVLSLPAGQRLDRSQVKVNESGQRVVGLSIAPAGAATGVRSGVVLAIDASRSMRGAPTEGALAAGRAFAGRRNVNQRIALLTFNETSKVALSFTTSQTSIERALSRQPTLRFKTRLYDAVAQAIGLVRLAGIEAGSVIVLSDGADTDSTVTLDQVIDAAKKAHVRVFTVGLRSKTFHPQPLQQLASATGGSFSRADSPGALETIYDQLGLQLAQEYILTYNSIAKPGRRVALSVAVGGVGTTTAAYVSPTIAPPNAVFRRSSSDSFWQSPLTMVLVALLVAALLAFAVFVPFRRHASTVRTRISDYVSTRKADGDPLVSRVFTGTERSLEQTRRWQRLKDTLQFADIGIPPVQFVLGTSIVTLFVMWILSLAAGRSRSSASPSRCSSGRSFSCGCVGSGVRSPNNWRTTSTSWRRACAQGTASWERSPSSSRMQPSPPTASFSAWSRTSNSASRSTPRWTRSHTECGTATWSRSPSRPPFRATREATPRRSSTASPTPFASGTRSGGS